MEDIAHSKNIDAEISRLQSGAKNFMFWLRVVATVGVLASGYFSWVAGYVNVLLCLFVQLSMLAFIHKVLPSLKSGSNPETTTEEVPTNKLGTIIRKMSFSDVLISAGLLVPIMEEFVFRLLPCELTKWLFPHNTLAMGISVTCVALLFVLYHYVVNWDLQSSFSFSVFRQEMITKFLPGVILGYLYVVFGYWYAVLVHSVFNSTCLSYMYLFEIPISQLKGEKEEEIQSL